MNFELIIDYILSLNPIWFYIAVFLISYIENIFPPFPSDVIIVAAGSLIAFDKIHFAVVLFFATTGSSLGFMTMYKIGMWVDKSVIEQGKIKFINLDQVHTVERWFQKYGYGVVVANRFLAGTRAVVSFFVGLSKLPIIPMLTLSFVSSLLWNTFLIYFGYKLGKQWHTIIYYLETYAKVITIIIIAFIFCYVIFLIIKKNKVC